jgi:hypothetical protein
MHRFMLFLGTCVMITMVVLMVLGVIRSFTEKPQYRPGDGICDLTRDIAIHALEDRVKALEGQSLPAPDIEDLLAAQSKVIQRYRENLMAMGVDPDQFASVKLPPRPLQPPEEHHGILPKGPSNPKDL